VNEHIGATLHSLIVALEHLRLVQRLIVDLLMIVPRFIFLLFSECFLDVPFARFRLLSRVMLYGLVFKLHSLLDLELEVAVQGRSHPLLGPCGCARFERLASEFAL